MTLTTDQMKSWVEELIGRNRILEEENKSLNSQLQRILAEGQGHVQEQDENFRTKLLVLEQEVKEVKTKMTALELGNQTLKLNMLEVVLRKLEILEQKISSGIETHAQEENPPIESDSVAPVSSDMKIPTEVGNNPLQRVKILRIVMGHMRPLDLLKCRQVSKLWRNSAQKDLQDKLTFHVKSNDDVKLFLIHSARSFPMFRNLKVELNGPREDNLKGMVQLFATHGQSLHRLQLFAWRSELEYCYYWTLDDFRDVFLSSLDQVCELQIDVLCQYFHADQMFFPHHVRKVLHNLTTLNIGHNSNRCGFNHISGDSQVSSDLLGLMPNLRTLYWRSVGRGGVNAGQDGSKNFIESLLLMNPIKLENLFIYSVITEDLVKSTANSNLNLKQLYFVNFRGFVLHFFSTPNAEGKKCEISPKIGTSYDGRTGLALKAHLENKMANTENMSCTKLLQVFMVATRK